MVGFPTELTVTSAANTEHDEGSYPNIPTTTNSANGTGLTVNVAVSSTGVVTLTVSDDGNATYREIWILSASIQLISVVRQPIQQLLLPSQRLTTDRVLLFLPHLIRWQKVISMCKVPRYLLWFQTSCRNQYRKIFPYLKL